MIFDSKEDICLEDLKEMQPALLILFTHAVLYCDQYSLPLKITSIKSDRDKVEAVSSTHEEGRAIDLSVKGWTQQQIHRFVYVTNKYYSDIAARSYSDNEPRAAVYHGKAPADHIHLQVRNYARLDRFIDYNK